MIYHFVQFAQTLPVLKKGVYGHLFYKIEGGKKTDKCVYYNSPPTNNWWQLID